MTLKFARADGDTGYSVELRTAHDAAVEQRRDLKKQLAAKYEHLMNVEYEARIAEIDAAVASVMKKLIDEGEPRSNMRKALRTGNNEVWRRYMNYVEAGGTESEPEEVEDAYTIDKTVVLYDFTNRVVSVAVEADGTMKSKPTKHVMKWLVETENGAALFCKPTLPKHVLDDGLVPTTEEWGRVLEDIGEFGSREEAFA